MIDTTSKNYGRYTVISLVIMALIGSLATTLVMGRRNVEAATYTANDTVEDNLTTEARELYEPHQVKIDGGSRRMYVADARNNRVLVYNLNNNNQLVDKTPDFVLGQPNFNTTSAGTTQTKMSYPVAVAVDAGKQRLFVSDSQNGRVLVFNVGSNYLFSGMAASAVLGKNDFVSPINETPSATNIGVAGGLAYDNNRLYVVDVAFKRVLVFSVVNPVNGQAAGNVLGQSDFTSSAANLNSSGFSSPAGVAYDRTAKRLFVSDGGDNGRVLVFDTNVISNGESAVNVLGQADFTSSEVGPSVNRFGKNSINNDLPSVNHNIGDLSYDATNNRLFVADIENFRVLVFDVSSITNGEDAIDAIGQNDFTSNESNNSSSGVGTPISVNYDTVKDRVIVSDVSSSDTAAYRVIFYNNYDPS